MTRRSGSWPGFNDIFVTIAIAMVFAAAITLIPERAILLKGPVAVCASWGLAEYFTRRRRMALPSIVLLLIFAGGVFVSAFLVVQRASGDDAQHLLWGHPSPFASMVAMAVTALAAFAHWRRFMVPITVAVGTLAAALAILHGIVVVFPTVADAFALLMLAAGIVIFGIAMWWDASDPRRVTRRADTAFWLHLAAAPMIVHPVFEMLHLFVPGVPIANAVVAVACYLLLVIIALAVDRRALLVSSLAYVLVAMSKLLSSVGTLASGFAVAALCIGTCLLLLSAAWHNARKPLVGHLSPWLQARLPPVE